ncbi:MAG TPA: nitroreductase/quinone reductase family protein [Aggregatilineales bacterium]|nr:nitroreductase family deazaflavin-dependent oxidoreductase [Anaerolineales bacterium]HRE46958.1 nitroreductase/quinone reductase family protein [Aggregatilineales bacterium]
MTVQPTKPTLPALIEAARALIPPESARLPIWLWRLGLGMWIGQVAMIISTTGRRSGQVRREAPPYFFVNGRKYVLAEADAQWVQNTEANPYATIQTAYGVEHVVVRRVTDQEELTAVWVTLMHNRPQSAQTYAHQYGIQSLAEDLPANADKLPLLTFDPADKPTPPPLQADLRWVLPIAGMLIGLLWRRKPQARRIEKRQRS